MLQHRSVVLSRQHNFHRHCSYLASYTCDNNDSN